MGWIRRLFRRTSSRSPPWVNPQFLVAFVTLVVSAGALWMMAGRGPEPVRDASAASGRTRQEFVGFADPVDVGRHVTPQCDAPCAVAGAMDAWRADHPSARVVEQEPVYEAGLLLGYRITYKEA